MNKQQLFTEFQLIKANTTPKQLRYCSAVTYWGEYKGKTVEILKSYSTVVAFYCMNNDTTYVFDHFSNTTNCTHIPNFIKSTNPARVVYLYARGDLVKERSLYCKQKKYKPHIVPIDNEITLYINDFIELIP